MGNERAFVAAGNFFTGFFFPLCVRDIKCSGNVQILPAKNGCFHSSPLANFKLIKK